MLQDTQLDEDQLKNDYLQKLFDDIFRILSNQDFRIFNFLYNIVFNKNYYELTRIKGYSEVELNYQIAGMMLYRFEGINITSTNQMISLIPQFIMFVIGQGLDINQCIKQNNENIWECFMTAVAKKINHQEDQANQYLAMFRARLEMIGQQQIAMDLDKTMNLINSYTKGDQLLKLLNLMFYQNCSIFAIYSSKSKNEFLNFQAQKTQQIIINAYNYISNQYQEEIQGTIEDSKMKVAISFLEKDYNYDYITNVFSNMEAGILIFNLIQLDHKQFQNFFQIKNPQLQDDLLNKIMEIAGSSDKLFFNLILVGKCLSKLRYWEQAVDIYTKLLKQIANNLNKDKFRVYINFKIYKIQFLLGQITGLLKKFLSLSDLMFQYQENHLEYYQPNNKNLYNQCLFIQLLICTYTKETDKLKHIILKINSLDIFTSNSCTNSQKKQFSMLQYEFQRLVKQQGDIFQEKDGKKQLKHILNEIKKVCQQRQAIEQRKSNNIFNIRSLFDSSNKKQNQLIEFKSYYKAVEELLIINVLVRYREIFILQYLNPNFYPLLRIFLNEKNFFNSELKSQIFLFIHDFEPALIIAIQQNNNKMIGQIKEYQERFQEAIEAYKKEITPSCIFNCAVLCKINQGRSSLDRSGFEGIQKQAIDYFQNLEQYQNQYKQIAQMFKSQLQGSQNIKQTTEKIERNSFQNSQQIQQILQQQTTLSQSFQEENNQLSYQNQQVKLKSSFDQQTSKTINMVESNNLVDQTSFSDSSNEQNQSQQIINIESQLRFDFQLREDIKFFYINLIQDIITEYDDDLKRTLDEFVKRTHFLKYESWQLFKDNDFLEMIGSGGNSNVYTFQFQNQKYAAKIQEFEYNCQGKTISDDEKEDIQKKLLEICILCDLTISQIKYSLQIEHLGFKFQMQQGQTKVYQIIIITKVYDKYLKTLEWEEMDKIKYIYKLTKGLITLQCQRELLHLDLKPENILVDSAKKKPVIADFGLSKYCQSSYHLDRGVHQMTMKYIDPDLAFSNFQSRKNDVYSFGVSLYYYFSGSVPYKGLNAQQVQGKMREFYKYHEGEINKIQSQLIKDLIFNCTQPIQDRITFVVVIKSLFLNLYKIDNPQDKLLIDVIFEQVSFYETKKNVKKIKTILKLIKTFINYKNQFQKIQNTNKILQTFQIVYSKKERKFSEIIQRMKQFINWVQLKGQDLTLELVDFNLNCIRIKTDEIQINFNFWIEEAQQIQSLQTFQWKPFLKDIYEILKQINKQSIYLLYLPLEQIYIKDDKIKIGCLEYSQNIKIDENNLYEFECTLCNPPILKTQQFSLENDQYAFQQLIQNIKTHLRLAQSEEFELFQNEIFSQPQASLQNVIDKILN